MPLLDAATTWSPGDLYLFAQPYILVLLQVVTPIVLGWIAVYATKLFGITVNQTAQADIAAAAASAAGRILASQDARFASMRIDVGHPLIAKEVPLVLTFARKAVEQLGLTPAHVGALIAGEVGHLQAQVASAAPAASADVQVSQ